MKHGYSLVLALLLVFTVFLGACGDSTATPVSTTSTTTSVPAATAGAPSSAPAATTGSSTSAASGETFNFSFTDKSGATITLNKKVERVVCLSFECMDWLAELGMEIVGFTQEFALFADAPHLFGSKAKQIPVINGSYAEPNLEEIARLKPDLVLANAFYNENLREPLKNIAPLALFAPKSYQEALDNFTTFAKAAGKETQAAASTKKFLAKLEAYRAKSPKSKTLLIFGSADSKNFFVQSNQTTNCSLLNEVAKCPWELGDKNSPSAAWGFFQVSMEQLLKLDPEVLFAYGYPTAPKLTEQLKDDPFWKNLKAVKNKQAYDVNAVIWEVGGPRAMGLLLDEAMPTLYPDVFPKALP